MMDVFLVWHVSIEIPFERARFWCEHGIDKVFHRFSAQSVRGINYQNASEAIRLEAGDYSWQTLLGLSREVKRSRRCWLASPRPHESVRLVSGAITHRERRFHERDHCHYCAADDLAVLGRGRRMTG